MATHFKWKVGGHKWQGGVVEGIRMALEFCLAQHLSSYVLAVGLGMLPNVSIPPLLYVQM
jgi:hypothetical protein